MGRRSERYPESTEDGADASAPGAARLMVQEPLTTGGELELGPNRGHYLRHVLRLPLGAAISVFNGRDGEWRAEIQHYAKDRCRIRLSEQRRPPEPIPGTDLWLLFAPIKRARIDLLVEKATELGVTRLQPVLTDHTDVARINLERLAAIACEAAEQCERLTVPELCPPVPLVRLLEDWPEADRRLLVCAEVGPARPMAKALREAPGSAAILVGPEGGFSPRELDDFRDRPFVLTVGLGPRILRAETAALAAIACWQALTGDWSDGAATDVRPPFRSGPSFPQP